MFQKQTNMDIESTSDENREIKIKKLEWGDEYEKKDKSKFNDKLWQSEKGTHKEDDEYIQINLHPLTKVETSFDLLEKQESIEKELKFIHLLESNENFKDFLKTTLKKRQQNYCWGLLKHDVFKYFNIYEKFSFFTDYFKLNTTKFYSNLEDDFKMEILNMLNSQNKIKNKK